MSSLISWQVASGRAQELRALERAEAFRPRRSRFLASRRQARPEARPERCS